MFTHPGKKLNFMGNEFAQLDEWKITEEIHWYELQNEYNGKFAYFFREMSSIYRRYPSLWEMDFNGVGFQWIDRTDDYNNIFAYIRRGGGQETVVVLNLSTNPQYKYILGLPHQGSIREIMCSDAAAYGGEGLTHNEMQEISPYPHGKMPCSVTVQIAPLSGHVFVMEEIKKDETEESEGDA